MEPRGVGERRKSGAGASTSAADFYSSLLGGSASTEIGKRARWASAHTEGLPPGYAGPAGPAGPPHAGPPHAGQPQRPAMRPRPTLRESLTASAASSRTAIGEANVGYQLLRKAGWTPGSGLGANEEGPTAPVPQFQKTDRRGLGAETPRSLALVGDPKGPPKDHREKRKRDGEGGGKQGEEKGGDEPMTEEEKKRAEAAKEAEKKKAKEAAIQRMVFRAFAENDVAGGTDEMNPLVRSLKAGEMSGTNPLRGLGD